MHGTTEYVILDIDLVPLARQKRFGGLAAGAPRRARLEAAFSSIAAHENALALRFLAGAARVRGLRVYGVSGADGRVPTFALRVEANVL